MSSGSWAVRNDIMAACYGAILICAAAYLIVSRRLPVTFRRIRGRRRAWGFASMSLAAVIFVTTVDTPAIAWTFAPSFLLAVTAFVFWVRAGRMGRADIVANSDLTRTDRGSSGKHASGRHGPSAYTGTQEGPDF